jgi:hypothetical protein
MPSRSKYDKNGRCIETQVGLIICSPGPHTGAPDPTTAREYRLFCGKCRSFCFYEGEDRESVFCSSCGVQVGMAWVEGGDLQ